MDKQPTQTPAERFRAEQERRGVPLTPEGAAQARAQLEAARAAWPPERFAALRERSKRAAREMFGRHANTPAA